MRGYTSARIAEKVRAAGGEIYAVTSEPQTLASRAQSEWEFDFESVGDPYHEIAGSCRERGWIELFVNEKLDFLREGTKDESDWSATHPKGHFQAGVLAVTAEGRVLYRWRKVPTRKNVGGALGRPTPEHVWSQIDAAFTSHADGDAALDEDAPLDSPDVFWPIFAALLVANGWFVRPLAFGYKAHDPKGKHRLRRAGVRLLGFVAAWAAAFWWGPPLWVGAALVAWFAWITPKLPFVNGEFQNIKPA